MLFSPEIGKAHKYASFQKKTKKQLTLCLSNIIELDISSLCTSEPIERSSIVEGHVHHTSCLNSYWDLLCRTMKDARPHPRCSKLKIFCRGLRISYIPFLTSKANCLSSDIPLYNAVHSSRNLRLVKLTSGNA